MKTGYPQMFVDNFVDSVDNLWQAEQVIHSFLCTK